VEHGYVSEFYVPELVQRMRQLTTFIVESKSEHTDDAQGVLQILRMRGILEAINKPEDRPT
jgi:hypothetical protein